MPRDDASMLDVERAARLEMELAGTQRGDGPDLLIKVELLRPKR